MKLNERSILCYGTPEQVAACIQGDFGVRLPAEFVDIFCTRPEAAMVFRSSDGDVCGVLRSTGRFLGYLGRIGDNISAMLFWQDGSVLRVHVVDTIGTLRVGPALNRAPPDPQQQPRSNQQSEKP